MNIRTIQKELQGIKGTLKAKFPDAIFRISPGAEPSPRTAWLYVYTDLGDRSEISELIIDREVELLVKKQFLLSILPRPLAYLPPPRPRNGKPRRVSSHAKPRARTAARAARERKTKYQSKSSKRKR